MLRREYLPVQRASLLIRVEPTVSRSEMRTNETGKSTPSRAPLRLSGKVALVTGGGRGIGRGIALTLAMAGADVILNDVHPDAAEEVAEEVRATGWNALVVKADVNQYEEEQRTPLGQHGRTW
jgi:phosphoglycerate dehydrogenase-like enzyme